MLGSSVIRLPGLLSAGQHGLRCRSRVLTVVLLLMAFAVAGCGGGGSEPPLADLHLPDVTKLPGSTALLARQPVYEITALATYHPPARASGDHVLVLLNTHLLDDLALAGGGYHQIAPVPPCMDSPPAGWFSLSAAPDGRSALCRTLQGIESFTLVGPAPGTGQLLLAADAGDQLLDPIWLPDGLHLAVVDNHLAGDHVVGCSVNLYTVAPSGVVRLQAELLMPQLLVTVSGQNRCALADLSASPDGVWLTITSTRQPPAADTLYGLSLAMLGLPGGPTGGPAPRLLTISPSQLVVLGQTQTDGPPTWRGRADLLTFVAPGRQAIVQLDLASNKQSTLLIQSAGEICPLTWEPDGQALVFVLCKPAPSDVAPPTPQIYLYTPPN